EPRGGREGEHASAAPAARGFARGARRADADRRAVALEESARTRGCRTLARTTAGDGRGPALRDGASAAGARDRLSCANGSLASTPYTGRSEGLAGGRALVRKAPDGLWLARATRLPRLHPRRAQRDASRAEARPG